MSWQAVRDAQEAYNASLVELERTRREVKASIAASRERQRILRQLYEFCMLMAMMCFAAPVLGMIVLKVVWLVVGY